MSETYLKIPPDMLANEEARVPTFGATSQRSGFDSGAVIGYGGYEWLERVQAHGWRMLSNWGADGWDLGTWPLVIVAHHLYETDEGKRFDLAQRIEGDITVWTFDDAGALYSATDRLASFWWRRDPEAHGEELAAALAATPEDDYLPPRFRGPFNRARLETQTEEVKT